MNQLYEKLENDKQKWYSVYDKIANLAKGKILYITKSLNCLYKPAPATYVEAYLVKIEIGSLTGDIKFTLKTADDNTVVVLVSRNFEGKAFGKILNIEIVMLKILDLFTPEKTENNEMESLASQAL